MGAAAAPVLSVVIPAYNEEARIGATLETLVAFLRPRWPSEVLVVDDGSGDRTAEQVQAVARACPAVRLIGFARNRGKGAAVREGMRQAAGAYVCFCDADLPVPVEAFGQLLERLQAGSDVVIASRALPASTVSHAPRLLRRGLSALFHAAVRSLFGLPFRDTQCGFKGFRRAAAQALAAAARVEGFAFDVELLLLARRLGFTVEELPVRITNAPRSSLSVEAHAGTILRDLWRIARRFARRAPEPARGAEAVSAGGPAHG